MNTNFSKARRRGNEVEVSFTHTFPGGPRFCSSFQREVEALKSAENLNQLVAVSGDNRDLFEFAGIDDEVLAYEYEQALSRHFAAFVFDFDDIKATLIA